MARPCYLADRPRYETAPGRAHRLGVVPEANEVTLSVLARHGSAVKLLLFDEHDNVPPAQVFQPKPAVHKTYFLWHVYVEGPRLGAHYACRVDPASIC